MIVKDEIEGILLYFLLQRHGRWHLSFFAHKVTILDTDAIKSDQIGTIVCFKLLDVHQKSLQLIQSYTLIFIEQKRTAVDTYLLYFIPSFNWTHWIDFIQKLYILVTANYVLLYLLRKIFNTFLRVWIHYFVYYCSILLSLTTLEWYHTIVFSILLYQSVVNWLKSRNSRNVITFVIGHRVSQDSFGIFDLLFNFFGRYELQSQSR